MKKTMKEKDEEMFHKAMKKAMAVSACKAKKPAGGKGGPTHQTQVIALSHNQELRIQEKAQAGRPNIVYLHLKDVEAPIKDAMKLAGLQCEICSSAQGFKWLSTVASEMKRGVLEKTPRAARERLEVLRAS